MTLACALAPCARAGAANLDVRPLSVDFGMVTAHTPTDPATITVHNLGPDAVVLADATADVADIAVDNRKLKKDLAPDETTTFSVTFTPPTTGQHAGHVFVNLGGDLTAADVPVTVTGVTPTGIIVRQMGGCSLGAPLPSSSRWLAVAVVALAIGLVRRRR